MNTRSSFYFSTPEYYEVSRYRDSENTVYYTVRDNCLEFSSRVEDVELKIKLENYFRKVVLPQIIENP